MKLFPINVFTAKLTNNSFDLQWPKSARRSLCESWAFGSLQMVGGAQALSRFRAITEPAREKVRSFLFIISDPVASARSFSRSDTLGDQSEVNPGGPTKLQLHRYLFCEISSQRTSVVDSFTTNTKACDDTTVFHVVQTCKTSNRINIPTVHFNIDEKLRTRQHRT